MSNGKITGNELEHLTKLAYSINQATRFGNGQGAEWLLADQPKEYRENFRAAVREVAEHFLAGKSRTPKQQHEMWLADRRAQGYKKGRDDNHDEGNLSSPSLMPWDDLPATEKMKSEMFLEAIRAFLNLIVKPRIAAEQEKAA